MTTMGAQAMLEGFLRDEPGLRHRPIHGVHQQQHTVHHREHAFHLAAEIGMTRRVHDVDVKIVPGDRGVLRKDGDATLALDRIRIHDPLSELLTSIERAGLAEKLVDEGGFAMIDVRDDGDVANFLHSEVPGKPAIIGPCRRLRRSFYRLPATIKGIEKIRLSITSSCRKATLRLSSCTPSAAGMILTLCRYT